MHVWHIVILCCVSSHRLTGTGTGTDTGKPRATALQPLRRSACRCSCAIPAALKLCLMKLRNRYFISSDEMTSLDEANCNPKRPSVHTHYCWNALTGLTAQMQERLTATQVPRRQMTMQE